MSQLMRLWCLSHRRQVKTQASLRIRAVTPEPSLFAQMKYGSRRRVRPKIRHLAPLDDCAHTFEEWVYGGRRVPYLMSWLRYSLYEVNGFPLLTIYWLIQSRLKLTPNSLILTICYQLQEYYKQSTMYPRIIWWPGIELVNMQALWGQGLFGQSVALVAHSVNCSRLHQFSVAYY